MHHYPDRTAWLQGGNARCIDPGPTPRRPWHVLLLGPPGVGKGTQAELIIESLGACHLSTGDVFRAAHHGCNGPVSPAMQEALGAMKRGELVSDATVVNLVRERVGCLCCAHGFLLDGFPRTRDQAEALDGMLAAAGTRLDAVINYTAAEEEILARVGGRRVCRRCKRGYHLDHKAPRTPGVCDACGGELYQRDDDRAEAVHTRLEAYRATARPVVEFYRAKGVLHEIDAHGSPGQVFEKTHAVLLAV